MLLKSLLSCTAIVLLCVGLSPAFAANSRTFVSGKGADTGACAITAPCRSFAYALTQTAVSGEIVVLDSAGYGSLSITQAVSISNPSGVEAGIAVPAGGAGITINASGARVDLRGLLIDGQGTGATGINIVDAQHVNINHIIVRNLKTAGINVQAGQASITGAYISNASTGVNLSSHLCCSLIDNSIITDNSQYGVLITSETISQIYYAQQLTNSGIVDNTVGVKIGQGDGGCELFISNSDIANNSSLDLNNSGVVYINNSKVLRIDNELQIESYGNNIFGNNFGNKPISQSSLQ